MRISEANWKSCAGIFAGIFIATATVRTALSQTSPVLTISPTGTNQFSITITNSIGSSDFDLQWTPVLASPDYPWTWAAIGTPGQTNYVVSGIYDTGFYRVILDTNSIPLWEAADPNNPSAGKLTVFIDSPTNGALIQ
jgi:hypothetical protein